MLAAGDAAPDFTLQDDSGNDVTLSTLRGRRVVLYFYPADDTPSCTKQACAIRDNWDAVTGAGVTLYGLSPDSIECHQRFRAKYGLPFPLLADPDHRVAEAYEVWVPKSRGGRTSHGIERSTFLVDEEGRIAQTWRKVNAGEHIALLLDALEMQPAPS